MHTKTVEESWKPHVAVREENKYHRNHAQSTEKYGRNLGKIRYREKYGWNLEGNQMRKEILNLE